LNNFENHEYGSFGMKHFEKCSYTILKSPSKDKWGVRAKALTRSLVPGWTHLRVHQCEVAESWDRRARSRLPTLERGRRSSWEPKD
jgi:hypothetical protein